MNGGVRFNMHFQGCTVAARACLDGGVNDAVVGGHGRLPDGRAPVRAVPQHVPQRLKTPQPRLSFQQAPASQLMVSSRFMPASSASCTTTLAAMNSGGFSQILGQQNLSKACIQQQSTDLTLIGGEIAHKSIAPRQTVLFQSTSAAVR